MTNVIHQFMIIVKINKSLKWLAIILFCLASNKMNSQIRIETIDSLDIYGNTKKALQLTLEYISVHGYNKSLAYNTACRYAKVGNVDSAFIFLDYAMNLGLKEIYFLVDDDLNVLRNEDRWKRITKIVEDEFKKKNSSILKPELAIEICKMGFKDQNGRQKILRSEQIGEKKSTLDSLWTIQYKQDSISCEYITNLIHHNSMLFPSISEIGNTASRYAFLMLQHSSYDVRKKHYKTIKMAMENNHLEKKYFAMYLDRLLIDEGKKQLYGTQMQKNNEGELTLFPVKRKFNMNRRRSKLGLAKI
ncbi:MAG: hypothetical protein IPP64_00180 [Bacteroidetes bacterium]|nr:hypothetical protein [Bacteroidota bacterium]